VVIGQQLADAKAAENARLSAGVGGDSPMPKSRYDLESGHFDLVSVRRLPIDDELRALTRQFRKWVPNERDCARQAMSMDEFYTLIHFAKRSAVLALNGGASEACEDGLGALAMIDESRIDTRDAAWAAGLLSYSVEKTSKNANQLFEGAIQISTTGVAKILSRASGRANLSDWGYAEIRTTRGVGLIRSAWGHYEPTVELERIALSVADWLDRQRYVATVEIAVDVPEIWFQQAFRQAARSVVDIARAVVSVQGSLRAGYIDDPSSQMFVLWLAELPSEKKSEELVNYSGCQLSGRFAVGFSLSRLFGLLVAGSVVDGVAPCESDESLHSLAEAIRSQIEDAWAKFEPK